MPKILESLSGVLADLVGLVFALYLVAGAACVLLAFARRAAGRPGFPGNDFPGRGLPGHDFPGHGSTGAAE